MASLDNVIQYQSLEGFCIVQSVPQGIINSNLSGMPYDRGMRDYFVFFTHITEAPAFCFLNKGLDIWRTVNDFRSPPSGRRSWLWPTW